MKNEIQVLAHRGPDANQAWLEGSIGLGAANVVDDSGVAS